jgi:hypothetical protein
MERSFAIWVLALPPSVWLAFRLRGLVEQSIGKTVLTLLGAGVAWYLLLGLLVPNVCTFSRQMSWQRTVEEYWFFAMMFPSCIYVASRAVARVNVRQAWAATLIVILWLSIMWGLMIKDYVHEYGRSPFQPVARSEAVD